MLHHRGAGLPSPVQPSGAADAITGGHRFTRRSRRPVDTGSDRFATITVSDILAHGLATVDGDRVTRHLTAPARREHL